MSPLLPRAILCCAWTAAAFAGVIHGVAIEQTSSRPLARTRVKLETLVSTCPQTAFSILTNRSGFAPVIWGQKRPYAAGLLIAVTRASVTLPALTPQRRTSALHSLGSPGPRHEEVRPAELAFRDHAQPVLRASQVVRSGIVRPESELAPGLLG